MTLMVRADVASVSVPTTSGGCGEPHGRPVVDGVSVYRNNDGSNAPWPITCPHCEVNLSEDIKRAAGKKVRTQNLDAGMKLADRYLGLFGQNEDMVPESPDEEKHREHEEQKAALKDRSRQTDSINSIAAAVQGNTELMAKFMELQSMIIAQHQQPVSLISSEPVGPAFGTLPAPEQPEGPRYGTYFCQDCSNEYLRTSNKGPAPKRCPDCKAKAAA